MGSQIFVMGDAGKGAGVGIVLFEFPEQPIQRPGRTTARTVDSRHFFYLRHPFPVVDYYKKDSYFLHGGSNFLQPILNRYYY